MCGVIGREPGASPAAPTTFETRVEPVYRACCDGCDDGGSCACELVAFLASLEVGTGVSMGTTLVVCVVVPEGVVTVMALGSEGSTETSMRYPTGRKVLNPAIRVGWPWKRRETRWMTPGVSILWNR